MASDKSDKKKTISPYEKEKALKKTISIYSSSATTPLISRSVSETLYSTASSTVGDFTYTGNPTQPHMVNSTSDPRYIMLGTSCVVDHRIMCVNHVGDPMNNAPGFDLATSIVDVTGDSWDSNSANPPTGASGAGAYGFGLKYGGGNFDNNFPTNPADQLRQIDVHFNSGHVERMEVLLPRPSQRFWNAWAGIMLTAASVFAIPKVFGCSASGTSSSGYDPFDWDDDWSFWSYGLAGTSIYKMSYVNSTLDPVGIFVDYASTAITNWSSGNHMHMKGWQAYDGIATSTGTTRHPAPGTASKQKWEILMDFLPPANSTGVNIHTQITSELANSTYNTPFSTVINNHISNSNYSNFFFVHYSFYTENLPSCAPPTYTIDGCTNPNNMAYWGYTGQDCASVAIPTAVQLDPNIAIWTPGSCCPDCINVNGDDITYSTQPLTLNVQGTDPTTIGGTDGYINVTILDQGFSTATNGIPQGLPTGTANYTYVIQNQNALDTMCGNTAGLGVGSGAVANTSFTFGNTVTSNVNGGLLQTGAVGSATYAASSAQGYVPGGTSTSAPYGLGTTNSEGFREGTYNVYVFDASTTVCLAQTTVSLADPAPTVGCTDSNALNYDAGAGISDLTGCHYCEATNGKLNEGAVVGPQNQSSIAQSTGTLATITYATNTTATDAEINITGISPTSLFQSYINNIVSGTTQNADYYVALYKWDTQSANGNSNWISTNDLTTFDAGTTIVGTAINNQGNGWNVNLTSSTLGAGITYGYYSIKVWVDDPDSASEQEQCYEIFDVIVPVPACVSQISQNAQQGLAADDVILTDSNLYFHDQAVCPIVTTDCCETPVFAQSNASTTCNLEYTVDVTCTPDADYTQIYLLFQDNGNWINVMGSGNTGPFSNYTHTFAQSYFNINGSGNYKVTFVSYYGQDPLTQTECSLDSNIEYIEIPIYGCTDSGALNYNVSAICDDGSCTYCVYGCTDPTQTNYNPLATCDDGSCYTGIPGCTDLTASNYNPLATFDDGSCQYLECGCTDPLASNYGYNIAGTLVGTPPPCDDGNCQYCEDPAMDFSYTSTAATVADPTICAMNCDGTVDLTVTSATGCTTYTIVYMYFFCGISNSNAYFIQDQDYTTGTTTITGICPKTWTILLEDCNGCQMEVEVTVGGGIAGCGCMDPAASNYCAGCTYDDGSCEYCGCTDDGAINYNPEATANCDPDTCEFPSLLPPCIPPTIDQTLSQIQTCIAENGFNYYNKLIIGTIDECSIMNVWKLILIDYLLKKKGLDCIYNCADANTPDAADVYISCEQLWITGGTTTGLNDANVNTLDPAVGTTSTYEMFTLSSTTELYPGDIIKHHNSGNIWIFYGPGQGSTSSGVSVAGLDPENASGNASGYWGYCNDNMRYISNTNNINYIDNFITFVNTFCRDCGNDLSAPISISGASSSSSINLTLGTNTGPIEDDTGIDIG